MAKERDLRVHERWAQLRFAVIGQLLAAPPKKGALYAALKALAAREWRHPVTGTLVRFGLSTIQRWYYRGLKETLDPLGVLRRKRRSDANDQPTMSEALRQALIVQHAAHTAWSAQLHHDNLAALLKKRPELGPMPSYATVRRFLRNRGMEKQRRLTSRRTLGALATEARLASREIRSFEVEYVGGLVHFDYHHCSRKVLTSRGEWLTPVLLGVVDDHSRLVCHMQWYLSENTENLVHGLGQAFMKRGVPRSIMSDNGAAMTAAETTEGFSRLGILHERTLPYAPHMNAKQETVWGPLEGRLMAMLEGIVDLSLAQLNEATQAWVEQDYNSKFHSEINETPLERFLAGPSVMRPRPDSATLRLAFMRSERRTLRKSDGTIVVAGRRFEVPNRYRHLANLDVRYASWDLSLVNLVDAHTGAVLCRLFPLDKAKNADGLRRPLEPICNMPLAPKPTTETPPLLKAMLEAQAASGLPPAYLVKDEGDAS